MGMRSGIVTRWRTGWLAALVLALLAPVPARADEAAAWAALRGDAAVVALMRHGDAPGVGDPAGWRLDDCSTQRNLGERGRNEARAAGEALRRGRARITRVISSPWCRCQETARLLALGSVQTEPAFSNAFVLREQREPLTAAARRVIDAWRGPGVLLVVSHGANIQALTGYSPGTTEVVVVSAGEGGAARPLGVLPAPAVVGR